MSVGPGLLISRKANIDAKGIETFTYVWRVICTTLNESEVAVATTTNIPAMWSAHPFNANALCKSKSIDQDTAQPLIWTVTVTYDTAPFEIGADDGTGSAPSPGETTQQTPPDDRPPLIKYSSNIISEPLQKDFSTPPKKVVNSAGVPFDPLPTYEVPITVISITDYSTSYDPSQKINYECRVNDDAVSIGGITYQPGKLLCRKLDGNSQFENASGRVWQRDAELWFHPYRFWDDLRLLDAGTVAYPNPTPLGIFTPSQITDDAGNSITQPVPLDGAGHKLESTDPDDYEFREFKVYQRANFVGVFGVAP